MDFDLVKLLYSFGVLAQMISEIGTVCFAGIQAVPIFVQVQIAGGFLPSFSIVGLPDKAVNESRDRVRSALHTLGIALPAKRIIINLSPANIQKEGAHYDLPLALGVLMAMEAVPSSWLSQAIALGEMGLDGSIKSVTGVLSAAFLAASQGKALVCPAVCAGEAMWGGDVEVVGPESLLQLIEHIRGVRQIPRARADIEAQNPWSDGGDFSDIKGQEGAKRAMLIAAAGGHNVLLSGPAGAGKSMLANRIMGILPELSPREALDVSMIHSVGGHLSQGKLRRFRSFRKPHHSISIPALVGGGSRCVPGEISLAHKGVLFLDELPEFSRHALESLRQPLETGESVVSRVNHRATYPADFQLIAAMNPCRCGHLGDVARQCHKAPQCGQIYQKSLSIPFLDRIDMFVEMSKVDLWKLAGEDTPRPSAMRADEEIKSGVPFDVLLSEPTPVVDLGSAPCGGLEQANSSEGVRQKNQEEGLDKDISLGSGKAQESEALVDAQGRRSLGIDIDVGTASKEVDRVGKDTQGALTSAVMKHLVERSWRRRAQANFPMKPCVREMEAELSRAPNARSLLLRIGQHMGLSARGYYRAARVARTIAFLEESDIIEPHHVYEAISYARKGIL